MNDHTGHDRSVDRSTMIHPPIEDLLDRVDSKFTLVSLAATRGRQINSYFSQLGEGLGAIVPPQVASVARKPLSIALEEIAADKIAYVRPAPDAEGEAAAEGEGPAGPALEAVPDAAAADAAADAAGGDAAAGDADADAAGGDAAGGEAATGEGTGSGDEPGTTDA